MQAFKGKWPKKGPPKSGFSGFLYRARTRARVYMSFVYILRSHFLTDLNGSLQYARARACAVGKFDTLVSTTFQHGTAAPRQRLRRPSRREKSGCALAPRRRPQVRFQESEQLRAECPAVGGGASAIFLAQGPKKLRFSPFFPPGGGLFGREFS